LGSLAEVGAHSINGSNDNRICCVSIPHEDIKDGVGVAEKGTQNGLGADTGEDGGRRQPPILIGVPGQRIDRLIDARIVPGSHAHVRQKLQEVGGIRRTVVARESLRMVPIRKPRYKFLSSRIGYCGGTGGLDLGIVIRATEDSSKGDPTSGGLIARQQRIHDRGWPLIGRHASSI
jgi:hypothetical protein